MYSGHNSSATPGCATPGCVTPGCVTPGYATPGCATPGCATPGCVTPGCVTTAQYGVNAPGPLAELLAVLCWSAKFELSPLFSVCYRIVCTCMYWSARKCCTRINDVCSTLMARSSVNFAPFLRVLALGAPITSKRGIVLLHFIPCLKLCFQIVSSHSLFLTSTDE